MISWNKKFQRMNRNSYKLPKAKLMEDRTMKHKRRESFNILMTLKSSPEKLMH